MDPWAPTDTMCPESTMIRGRKRKCTRCALIECNGCLARRLRSICRVWVHVPEGRRHRHLGYAGTECIRDEQGCGPPGYTPTPVRLRSEGRCSLVFRPMDLGRTDFGVYPGDPHLKESAPHGDWQHFDAREWLTRDPSVEIKHTEDRRVCEWGPVAGLCSRAFAATSHGCSERSAPKLENCGGACTHVSARTGASRTRSGRYTRRRSSRSWWRPYAWLHTRQT